MKKFFVLMRCSDYTIQIPLHASSSQEVLMHGYTGAIDIVPESTSHSQGFDDVQCKGKKDYALVVSSKRLIISCLLSVLTLFCAAQNRVSGYVLSNTLDSLDCAIVIVLCLDSALIAHVTTDSMGYYEIDSISVSKGLIHVSSLGYEPALQEINFPGEGIKLDFRLKPMSEQLNEVVVNGSRIMKHTDGHVVAIPTKEEKRHSFGGIDMLANMMIPGVTVDRTSGQVSAVFGKATLYINGIKATLQ